MKVNFYKSAQDFFFMNPKETIHLIILLIVLVYLLEALFGLPAKIGSSVTGFLESLIPRVLIGVIAGGLVEYFTGSSLKTIVFRFPLVSISAFAIATFIVGKLIG